MSTMAKGKVQFVVKPESVLPTFPHDTTKVTRPFVLTTDAIAHLCKTMEELDKQKKV